VPRRKRLTWAQAQERFLTHLRARNLSARTVYCYGLEVTRLAAYRGGSGPHDVSTEDLRAYQAGLLAGTASRSGRPLTGRSVYRVACTLGAFFSWLVSEGLLKKSPGAQVERPKLNQSLPPGPLSEEEAARLLDAASAAKERALGEEIAQRDRAAVELLYATGLRRAELVALDLPDVDLRERLVTVRHGKGDKARQVPLARSAALRVESYLTTARPALVSQKARGEEALLLTRWGRRLGSPGVRRLLLQAAERAGIERPVTPHVLRRSFATHLLRAGADLRSIQLLLGHSELSTTAVYLQLDSEELRQEILTRHPRERLDP